jgi:hypothetical protein
VRDDVHGVDRDVQGVAPWHGAVFPHADVQGLERHAPKREKLVANGKVDRLGLVIVLRETKAKLCAWMSKQAPPLSRLLLPSSLGCNLKILDPLAVK